MGTPHLTLFWRQIRKKKLFGSAYLTEINYIKLLESLQGLYYTPHLTLFLYTPNLTLFLRQNRSHQQLSLRSPLYLSFDPISLYPLINLSIEAANLRKEKKRKVILLI